MSPVMGFTAAWGLMTQGVVTFIIPVEPSATGIKMKSRDQDV